MPMNRSRKRSTESSEDYLEAILRIRSERGSCRNVDIACLLGYSKASVTKALAACPPPGSPRWLPGTCADPRGGADRPPDAGAPPLLRGAPARGGRGREDRLAEACRMEHCLSEGSFEKLAALLGEGAAGRT